MKASKNVKEKGPELKSLKQQLTNLASDKSVSSAESAVVPVYLEKIKDRHIAKPEMREEDRDVKRKDKFIDKITRMKKTIDDIIARLLKEKTDEITHKDFCADVFNLNQLETEKTDCEKSDLTTKIEDLKMTNETPTKETHGANWLSFRGRDVAPAALRSRERLMRDDRGRLRHWCISGRLLQPVPDGRVHRHLGRGQEEGARRHY